MQSYNYFDIHTHRVDQSGDIIAVRSCRAPESPPVEGYFSYGVHPYDVLLQNAGNQTFDYNNCRLVAIGEVGLDFRFKESVREQVALFEQQLKLAVQWDLPVVVHCVKAYPQTLQMLRKAGVSRFVFHGFNSSIGNALKIIDQGGGVSFGTAMIGNDGLQNVLKAVFQQFSDRVHLESDESSKSIKDIYMVAADVCEVSLEELKRVLSNNFKTFFGV